MTKIETMATDNQTSSESPHDLNLGTNASIGHAPPKLAGAKYNSNLAAGISAPTEDTGEVTAKIPPESTNSGVIDNTATANVIPKPAPNVMIENTASATNYGEAAASEEVTSTPDSDKTPKATLSEQNSETQTSPTSQNDEQILQQDDKPCNNFLQQKKDLLTRLDVGTTPTNKTNIEALINHDKIIDDFNQPPLPRHSLRPFCIAKGGTSTMTVSVLRLNKIPIFHMIFYSSLMTFYNVFLNRLSNS